MKTILQKIIKNEAMRGKFFNTLSMLEYIGARKIFKSQVQEEINFNILAHAAEESRHALVLKKAALKYAPDLCQTFNSAALLAGDAAIAYIQGIDHFVKTLVDNYHPWHCYLLTTYAVEQRAAIFYTMIDEVLVENNLPTVFRGILVEEDRHLTEMTNSIQEFPALSSKLSTLLNFEDQQFQQMLQAFDQAL